MRSRPTYPGLRAVPEARRHLVAVDLDGARAAVAMLEVAPAGVAERTEVLALAGALPGTGVDVHRSPDTGALLAGLGVRLSTATMGTRVYAAGSEGFVGRVVGVAVEHGVDAASVVTEHVGTLARRVQCVHCKRIAEEVTTSVVGCGGCGRLLLVRDHYSRRLAAFQGVCVDAEDPSERPEPEVAYP